MNPLELIQKHALRESRLDSGHAFLSVPRRKLPSRESVARAIGIQSFCCGDSHRRTFLLKAELTRYFPTLFQAGLPRGYYVDVTGKQPVLGHLRVDVGPDDIVRIVQRCHQLARRHRQLSGFQRLIAAGQFEITYLVATDQKARRLSVALSPLEMTGVRCVVEPVPSCWICSLHYRQRELRKHIPRCCGFVTALGPRAAQKNGQAGSFIA